jgi:hypothetical protein
MLRPLPALLLLVVTGAVGARAEPAPDISIVTGTAPSLEAQHGIDEIIAALRERNVPIEMADSPDNAHGNILLIAGLAGDRSLFHGLLEAVRRSVPQNAEALAIQKRQYHGRTAWAIAGFDNCGLMYAELDLAERIRLAPPAEPPLAEARETIEKPDVATRGITLFAMNRAYWESRFYDETYWRRYFDLLAQDRFNSVTVVLGYENGGFLAPCYPYFFDVPEYPGVRMIGITAEQQARNVEALNQMIAMAHARGIKLSIGIWDHIYRGNVQNGGSPGGNSGLTKPTPNLVWGVTAENLIPYTQAALTEFLRRFPGLDGIEFRMHNESGLKPSEQGPFWKAIFQTIMETNPKLPLDLRAKGLTPEEIQSAIDSGVNFRLSTKYWMEQMGLPFHPTHINPRDQDSARHSYANLLTYPQRYRMDWQLWNGGTARILLWGDPEYARRFAQSTHLYGGDSFEVDDPLATKMEGQLHDAKPFDLLKSSARYYDYEFERYWHFFELFGRIGYNLDTPSDLWDMEFQERFGPDAGPILENALHQASWILPRIIASSYPYGGFPMTAGWPEKQHLGDLPSFAKMTPSDVQLFENFDEEAQLMIAKGETPKVRPQATSLWFSQTASALDKQIAIAEKTIGSRRGKEFDSTIIDLKILSGLARYHSQRIPAAVCYRLFVRTGDPAALDDAIDYESKAVEAWRQIVDAAGDTYAPDLMMGARTRNLCGNWKDELESLESDLNKLKGQRNALTAGGNASQCPRYEALTSSPRGPAISHQPLSTAPAQKPLIIRAHVDAPSGVKWVQVLYRAVDQTKDYQVLDMKEVDGKGTYEAVIPAETVDPQFDFMYLIQAMDNDHNGTIYPDFNKQTPYFIVHLDRGTSPYQ